jgi:Phosphoglycerol transferase and related proteins, alkaline phosphatase superfamily
MTVSGHLRYTFDGNAMSDKNRELVKNLPYSSAVKAYFACNIEFDRAMGELISRLEKAGIADDTLIAISPDHYPYGLTNKEISELAGHTVETNFELYKGIFILWSKGIKSEEISKPCASLDILPTLSNLMGVEYDSRLLMGRDIFSDAPPLVVFSNWSWLTDKARYNSKEGKLILSKGETKETVNKQYRSGISKRVNNMFTYSSKILDTNYYEKVLKSN